MAPSRHLPVGLPAGPDARHVARAHRLLRFIFMLSALTGLLLSGLLVYGASDAAFNGQAVNPSSAWTAGKVAVSDDDGGAAMFSVTAAKPGDTGSKCITVSYAGDLTVPVKLYVSASSGTLRTYLTLTVEQGTGGSFADCSALAGTSTLWGPGNLATFATTYSAWSSGLTGWTPTGSGQSRTYRLTWSLDDNDSAANTSATATFMWEVRSS
jgi:hypothetical protein